MHATIGGQQSDDDEDIPLTRYKTAATMSNEDIQERASNILAQIELEKLERKKLAQLSIELEKKEASMSLPSTEAQSLPTETQLLHPIVTELETQLLPIPSISVDQNE